jgi:hypothetical protein
MTRAEIELLEECKIQLMHIHDVCERKPFYTTKNLIKNIDAAISVTRCCEELCDYCGENKIDTNTKYCLECIEHVIGGGR